MQDRELPARTSKVKKAVNAELTRAGPEAAERKRPANLTREAAQTPGRAKRRGSECRRIRKVGKAAAIANFFRFRKEFQTLVLRSIAL